MPQVLPVVKLALVPHPAVVALCTLKLLEVAVVEEADLQLEEPAPAVVVA